MLTRDQVHQLVDWALAYAVERDELLARVPASLMHHLERKTSVAEQILADVIALNRLPASATAEPGITAWISGLRAALGPYPAAAPAIAQIDSLLGQGGQPAVPAATPLEHLRARLVRYFDDARSIRRILEDSGVRVDRVDFSGGAARVWRCALTEAARQGRVDAVAEALRAEYPAALD